MSGGDFFSNETSVTLDRDVTAKIVLTTQTGDEIVLKDGLSYPKGCVVDASFMSVAALSAFLAEEIEKTRAEGVLFSLHMKATMMKVSDPIIFGHAVRAWLAPVFEAHADRLADLGVNPNSGLGDLLERVQGEVEIMQMIDDIVSERPPMYMVDSDRGITNLHVPSDVIIDASMPALIRAGGKGWGPDGKEHDAVCVIPDNSYAPVYDETIEFFKANGALNPATAGTVQNLGLMAQKAEEYGSHPTTFEMPAAAPCGWSRVMAPFCMNMPSRPAISGGPPPPGRRPSKTGCSWPSTGRPPPATARSSGWMRPAPMMRS